METILDHNITKAEFKKLGFPFKTIEEYIAEVQIQHHCYYGIALLYELRGDDKNADKYMKLSGYPVGEIIDVCL